MKLDRVQTERSLQAHRTGTATLHIVLTGPTGGINGALLAEILLDRAWRAGLTGTALHQQAHSWLLSQREELFTLLAQAVEPLTARLLENAQGIAALEQLAAVTRG
jgi:hypothetical protein